MRNDKLAGISAHASCTQSVMCSWQHFAQGGWEW